MVRVLDAADEVLAREGADALTTAAVATAAGVSVGSLYQYFPDKEAIAEALAIRYWGELQDLVDAAAEANEQGSLDDPMSVVIDGLAAGFRARPGFLALWFGGLRSERVRNVTRPGRTHVARAVERILAVHWPESGAAQRGTVARMVVLAGDGLLREAFRLDPEGDPTVLEETKRLLSAYITERLGEDGR